MPNDTTIDLTLTISDPDLCAELSERPEGEQRNEFAVTSMKIGSLALRQAQGRIDADRVRAEGERLIENMIKALDERQEAVTTRMSNFLQEYFHPESGRFNERVRRLIGQDGELENLIRSQIAGDGSVLTRTLRNHVGVDSKLMKTLDPDSADGLIHSLAKATENTLEEQNKQILKEFSLDNKDGAITRLISELEKKNGDLMGEFSLDNEDSALSRLVSRVEAAQGKISREFSLDQEDSALARMRKELKEVLQNYVESSQKFQTDVREQLAAMVARRQEADRSTRHGQEFEDAVFAFVDKNCQRSGDLAKRTGNEVGVIKHNKKGDIVVKIGPDKHASGTQIVIEAKERDGYTLGQATKELEEARRNREADVGLFIFSKHKSPENIEQLARYGNDIIIVWDADDSTSDVILDAGLATARAICVQTSSRAEEHSADFDAIIKAIREIERQAKSLEEITRFSSTIKSNSEKILHRAAIAQEGLKKEVEILDEKIHGLQRVMGDTGDAAPLGSQSRPPRRSQPSSSGDSISAVS